MYISFLRYNLLYLQLFPLFTLFYNFLLNLSGGGKEDRTPDPLLAKQVLSQLSYTPKVSFLIGRSPAYSRCLEYLALASAAPAYLALAR